MLNKEQLESIKEKYKEVNDLIMDPNLLNDMEKYQEAMIEHSSLQEIYDKVIKYESYVNDYESNKALLYENVEEELKDLVKEEQKELEEKIEKVENEIKVLLIPKDPNDERNVIMEIRAGTGGDEAALFAGDLFRMYTRYAEKMGWAIDIISTNEIGIGGYKEAIFMINGKGAYSKLKYESGVHRVQRVPETESGGRVHTSAATVSVMPEAKDVEVNIDPNDLKIDVYRSSGHGGQSVNTTDSAVRVTHIPTGLVVACQDEKSQLKNKDKAIKVLKSRLYEIKREEQEKELAAKKRSQVGSGDRSERIRTYNFPQGRITDHRINKTIYQLQDFLNGYLDEMIEALSNQAQIDKMAAKEL
ncbi:MAG: peptide chain release factor 1 [Ezakiella sp.]|nr:peptide chain release factor 1 [Ezakiella sp.]MDD7471924.1 peptide chain release factor 1 [Bacillota bacterium]MDY3923888.1 peptide chain release factor 1 [Ezakiella sp.]